MEKKEIDLTRMQQLLNGFTADEIDNNKAPLPPKSTKSLDHIDSYIDLQDIFQILSHEGTILGLSDKAYPHELKTKVLNNCKDTLKDAKAILVIHYIHPDTAIFSTEEIMQGIYDILGDNKPDFLFDVQEDVNLPLDQIGFKLLYIVDNIEPDYHKNIEILEANGIETKLHKQLYDENHTLRNQLTSSKSENENLKQQIRRLENSLMVLSSKIN